MNDKATKTRKKKRSAQILQLVPKSGGPDQDTIDALGQLMRRAIDGKVIGLAFVAIYNDRKYIHDTAGEARRDPVLARAAVACLDDLLSFLSN